MKLPLINLSFKSNKKLVMLKSVNFRGDPYDINFL